VATTETRQLGPLDGIRHMLIYTQIRGVKEFSFRKEFKVIHIISIKYFFFASAFAISLI